MSPTNLLDVIWWWIMQNLDSVEREKLGQKVWMPPRGEEPHPKDPYWGEEAELRAAAEMDKKRR